MTTRHLAAILAADVVAFSSMMERDEDGTATKITALRWEVIEPAIARHHGRLVKTTGDGFLAEFANPVEAVLSALSIQDRLAAGVRCASGITLRVGVNSGEILFQSDGDVLGDGVNIAARLQQLAGPGEVVVSDEVHRLVAGEVARAFENRGEQHVKNISRPIRVFALRPTAQVNDGALDEPATKQNTGFCFSSDGVRIAWASIGSGPAFVKVANSMSHLEFDWASPAWRYILEGLERVQRSPILRADSQVG